MLNTTVIATLQKFWNKYVWESERSVNLEDPRKQINGITVSELFGGTLTKSNKSVNVDNALTLSAMWRGVQVLCGACSSIPFKVYKKSINGREEVKSDELPAVALLTKRPNRKITSRVWIDRAINHLHLRGNHYALPIYNPMGQVVELEMIKPDLVTVYEDRNDVYYKIQGVENPFPSNKFIHVPHLGDGTVGKSTINYAKEDLGLEMSRRDYGAGVYASGARPPALLKTNANLTPEQMRAAQESWSKVKQLGQDALLPFGFDYTPLTFKPDEVEFLQSGNFSVSTIARWLGVPPHKLYDLDRATFSNIEHMAIEFIQDTIAPILVKFEAEYTSKLFQLPKEEKAGYYAEFNMNAYVRADLITRSNAYSTQVHSAVLKPSEARSLENREFVEGSDRLFINQGSAPLDMIDVLLNKKQPVSMKAEAKLKEMFNGRTKEILEIINE